MLRLFASYNPAIAIVLFVYAIILKGKILLNPVFYEPENPEPLSELVYTCLDNWFDNPALFASILALLCIFYQAWTVNGIANESNILGQNTFYPGLFYILLTSAFESLLYLSPLLLAMTFQVHIVGQLFKIYGKGKSDGRLFNIGLLLALSSLFYFPMIAFLPYILITISSFRSFTGREVLVFLSGLLNPYLLLSAYFFWFDKFVLFWSTAFDLVVNIPAFDIELNLELIIKFNLIAILIISTLVFMEAKYMNNLIKVRKFISAMLSYFFVGFFTFFLMNFVTLNSFLVFCMPLSICFAYYVKYAKANITSEVVHLLFLIVIIFFQYTNFT